jgi:hypothetical protein
VTRDLDLRNPSHVVLDPEVVALTITQRRWQAVIVWMLRFVHKHPRLENSRGE